MLFNWSRLDFPDEGIERTFKLFGNDPNIQ